MTKKDVKGAVQKMITEEWQDRYASDPSMQVPRSTAASERTLGRILKNMEKPDAEGSCISFNKKKAQIKDQAGKRRSDPSRAQYSRQQLQKLHSNNLTARCYPRVGKSL